MRVYHTMYVTYVVKISSSLNKCVIIMFYCLYAYLREEGGDGFVPRYPSMTYQYYTFSLFGNYSDNSQLSCKRHVYELQPPPPKKKLYVSCQIPEDHERPHAFKITIL